jgi:hypothetical protein
MSKLRSTFSQVALTRGGQEPIASEFRDEYPELAMMMGGADPVDGQPAILPHSLILFWEGTRLKFCLSNKRLPNCCFGTVGDASKGLYGVEKALVDGDFEWKPRRVH